MFPTHALTALHERGVTDTEVGGTDDVTSIMPSTVLPCHVVTRMFNYLPLPP